MFNDTGFLVRFMDKALNLENGQKSLKGFADYTTIKVASEVLETCGVTFDFGQGEDLLTLGNQFLDGSRSLPARIIPQHGSDGTIPAEVYYYAPKEEEAKNNKEMGIILLKSDAGEVRILRGKDKSSGPSIIGSDIIMTFSRKQEDGGRLVQRLTVPVALGSDHIGQFSKAQIERVYYNGASIQQSHFEEYEQSQVTPYEDPFTVLTSYMNERGIKNDGGYSDGAGPDFGVFRTYEYSPLTRPIKDTVSYEMRIQVPKAESKTK